MLSFYRLPTAWWPLASSQRRRQPHVQEDIQREAVFLDPAAQDRTFPGVEQEDGQVLRRESGGDAAVGLAVADGAGDGRRPDRVHGGEALEYQRAAVTEFAAEVAQQAAVDEFLVDEHIVQTGEVLQQPFRRGDRLVRQYQAAGRVEAVALDDIGAQRFLAGEVVIERALRHAGCGGDVEYARRVVTVVVHRLQSGGNDIFSEIRFGHAVIIRPVVSKVKGILKKSTVDVEEEGASGRAEMKKAGSRRL